MSRFTETRYFRCASLFIMCATFLDEIRSRPVSGCRMGKRRTHAVGWSGGCTLRNWQNCNLASIFSKFVGLTVNFPSERSRTFYREHIDQRPKMTDVHILTAQFTNQPTRFFEACLSQSVENWAWLCLVRFGDCACRANLPNSKPNLNTYT